MTTPTTTILSTHPRVQPRRRRSIDDWRPEDEAFWTASGSRVARRNLALSILSEHIGFCVWSMWSAFVLFLGPEYGFDASQKFLLTTLPTAVGAAMRIPYTFAVARFGGRNWTIFSSAVLCVPLVATAVVLEPGVSFGTLLGVAVLAGVGGGNFSSSMANIDAFYPQRLKGWALGLNAGGGNLGVAAVQLAGLAVLATAGAQHPRLIIGVYLPLVAVAVVGAAVGMDNLTSVSNDRGAMREVLGHRDSWLISLLYIGTFGSFIGFGFAFGQVLQVQFAGTFDTPSKVASLTFLGPLLGSLARPVGGLLADRLGGAKVTLVSFGAMAVAASVVVLGSMQRSLGFYLPGFIALFLLSGIGNGSTYKMIPARFGRLAAVEVANGADPDTANKRAKVRSRALIGIAGSIGAFGGVGVNLAFRQSFLSRGDGDAAFVTFIAVYLACMAVTWLAYVRPVSSGVPMRSGVPT